MDRLGVQMRKEIREQPEAILATVTAEKDRLEDLTARLRREGTEYILIVARGTSDNAAMYGLYMLGAVTMKLAATVAPSLLTCYETQVDLRKTLVLGVSQSGKATDVIEYLAASRERGAITCALTNTDDSPICQTAEHLLLTHAQEERAVAATKTYTTALVLLHQLSTLWAGRTDLADQIQRVPDWIRDVLALEEEIAFRAERFRFMDTCHWLARGYNYATAKEAALKMAECCYVIPSPFSTADFMHGPIATTGHGFPCFIVNPLGKTYPSVTETVDAIQQQGGEITMISNCPDMLSRGRLNLRLPDMPEELSPMAAGVVGQLLALYVAVEKGLDPDQPRGLSKVTLTR